jgi:hypothetical protein
VDIEEFGRGVAAALLTDQVSDKAGLAYKVGVVAVALTAVSTVVTDSWLRWLALLFCLFALGFVLLVFITKRFATATISRIAPPVDIASARTQFDVAVAEADIPTGPVGFLRLMWRLRKGVGPEVDRLIAVVNQLRSEPE